MNLSTDYTLKGIWLATIAVAFALAVGTAITVSIVAYADFGFKGPLGIGFHYEGWKPKAERLQGTIDGFAAAQHQAKALAEQQLRAKEREYADKAKEADDDYTHAKARTDSATARYIADHRIPAGGMQCPSDRSAAGAAASPAEGGSAGVPEEVPADPFVAVRQSDVHRCSDLAPYAVGAHDWARGLTD